MSYYLHHHNFVGIQLSTFSLPQSTFKLVHEHLGFSGTTTFGGMLISHQHMVLENMAFNVGQNLNLKLFSIILLTFWGFVFISSNIVLLKLYFKLLSLCHPFFVSIVDYLRIEFNFLSTVSEKSFALYYFLPLFFIILFVCLRSSTSMFSLPSSLWSVG